MVLIHKRRMNGHYTFGVINVSSIWAKFCCMRNILSQALELPSHLFHYLSRALSGLELISIKILAQAPVFINFTCHRKIYLGKGYILLITRKIYSVQCLWIFTPINIIKFLVNQPPSPAAETVCDLTIPSNDTDCGFSIVIVNTRIKNHVCKMYNFDFVFTRIYNTNHVLQNIWTGIQRGITQFCKKKYYGKICTVMSHVL